MTNRPPVRLVFVGRLGELPEVRLAVDQDIHPNPDMGDARRIFGRREAVVDVTLRDVTSITGQETFPGGGDPLRLFRLTLEEIEDA